MNKIKINLDNIAPKLQNAGATNLPEKSYKKMLKQPNFFHSQLSTLPKDAPAKVYLPTSLGSSFVISSGTPTRSLTFYAFFSHQNRKPSLNNEGWQQISMP